MARTKIHLGAMGWSQCGLKDLNISRFGDHDGYATT